MLVAHDVNPLVARTWIACSISRAGRAALWARLMTVVNEDTLSRLYDRPVDVLRVARPAIIVVAGDDPETAHGHAHA